MIISSVVELRYKLSEFSDVVQWVLNIALIQLQMLNTRITYQREYKGKKAVAIGYADIKLPR